jgi:hypothetical protein
MIRAAAVLVALLLAGCGATGAGEQAPPVGASPGSTSATASKSGGTTAARPRHPHYVFPVRGCPASPSSSHHDYPAADIFTDRGCRFVATTSGRVDEVSARDRWDPAVDAGATRGGRSVSIVGDDGVRYYGSHLLRIAPGIRPGVHVHAGQLLGLIDNSGDARYTPTHVHYGISWPTRPGVWWVRRGEVWPQRYLAAWRAGHNLSPRREVRRAERRTGRVPPCRVEC